MNHSLNVNTFHLIEDFGLRPGAEDSDAIDNVSTDNIHTIPSPQKPTSDIIKNNRVSDTKQSLTRLILEKHNRITNYEQGSLANKVHSFLKNSIHYNLFPTNNLEEENSMMSLI